MDHSKFLQLLYSPDEANIGVALEMAKGLPAFEPYIATYLTLAQCFLRKNLKKVNAKHIAQLNQEVLHLVNKKITSLPPQLDLLKNLRILDLKRNQLASFPGNTTGLENLVELH